MSKASRKSPPRSPRICRFACASPQVARKRARAFLSRTATHRELAHGEPRLCTDWWLAHRLRCDPTVRNRKRPSEAHDRRYFLRLIRRHRFRRTPWPITARFGITIKRPPTDNRSAYRSSEWAYGWAYQKFAQQADSATTTGTASTVESEALCPCLDSTRQEQLLDAS